MGNRSLTDKPSPVTPAHERTEREERSSQTCADLIQHN
jgi:hypothetical protein